MTIFFQQQKLILRWQAISTDVTCREETRAELRN
jgi:hypothetical protein